MGSTSTHLTILTTNVPSSNAKLSFIDMSLYLSQMF